MNILSYKYLKYKSKYQNEKNLIGGKSKNNISLFKASWCPHCVAFETVWNQLQKDSQLNTKVKFNTYDSEIHTDIIQSKNITGYPTLILSKGNKEIEYNGARVFDAVKDFILSYVDKN
jgi:thiol-disulfide isomerase/thioredoxin